MMRRCKAKLGVGEMNIALSIASIPGGSTSGAHFRQGAEKFEASIAIVEKILQNLCRMMWLVCLKDGNARKICTVHRMQGRGCL